jgi:hypothetical protein
MSPDNISNASSEGKGFDITGSEAFVKNII